MAISFNELNHSLILKDLGSLCLKCNSCNKTECMIGYAKNCIMNCVKENVTYVENGVKNIPQADIKSYDQDKLIVAIADILHMCNSCKQNHFEDCIINTLRSCYEIDLFGEVQKYNGDAVDYIIRLNTSNYKKGIASRIVDQYHKTDYESNK